MNPTLKLSIFYLALSLPHCGQTATVGSAPTSVAAINTSPNQLFDLGFAGLSAADRNDAIGVLSKLSLADAYNIASHGLTSSAMTVSAQRIPNLAALPHLTKAQLATISATVPNLGALWASAGVRTDLSAAAFAIGLDDLVHRLRMSGAAFKPVAADYAVQANLMASALLSMGQSAQSSLALVTVTAALPPGSKMPLGASRMSSVLWKLKNCPTTGNPPFPSLPSGNYQSFNQTDMGSFVSGASKNVPTQKELAGQESQIKYAYAKYDDAAYAAVKYPNGGIGVSCEVTGDLDGEPQQWQDLSEQARGALNLALPVIGHPVVQTTLDNHGSWWDPINQTDITEMPPNYFTN